MLAHDVENKYDSKDKNKSFAYIECETTVDGENIVVKLAIKKSSHKNKFWVHSIYTTENVSDSPAITNTGNGAGHITADVGRIVTQDSLSVNSENSEVKKSSRGMRGVFAEEREAIEEAACEGEEDLKKEMARRDGNIWKKVKNVILQFIEKTSVFLRVTVR